MLAHVWQGDNQAEWAASHFTYLIRTFWIGFLVSVVLTITIIGMIALPLPAIWVAVRSVLSLNQGSETRAYARPQDAPFLSASFQSVYRRF